MPQLESITPAHVQLNLAQLWMVWGDSEGVCARVDSCRCHLVLVYSTRLFAMGALLDRHHQFEAIIRPSDECLICWWTKLHLMLSFLYCRGQYHSQANVPIFSKFSKGLFINFSWGGVAEYRGGHQFLMNAYRGGGSFTFQTINGGVMIFVSNPRGGSWFLSAIQIRKSADLIPDAYKFWKREGMLLIFLTLMGGVMQFYHLGIGGGHHFFSYSEALSAAPPPLKFMNSP